jgi:glycosyltransferase involved in cell wall biosynthesis
MMEVSYDSEIFSFQKHGGVSRLFSELIREFASNPNHGISPVLSFKRTDNSYLRELAEEKIVRPFKPLRRYLAPDSPLRTLLTMGPIHDLSLSVASGSKRTIAKVLHSTYYRPTLVESRSKDNLVVTVHDFIPERLGWSWVRNPHFGKKSAVSKAGLVVCVSETSAIDLRNFYGDISTPVIVVPHGVRTISSQDVKLKAKTERPYLLYVGHRSGYKSFKTLGNAMRLLAGRRTDLQLVTAGPTISDEERKMYGDLISNNTWIHLGNISDSDLKMLYRNATLTCLTSKYEGFGLPIIESLAEGTTVVTPRIPVFEEVGGNAVAHFEFGNPESLSDVIENELNEAWDSNSIELRINRASQFKWSMSAARMAEAYKSLN